LREAVSDASITLISKDLEGSYRPSLLPKLIAGKIREEDLYVSGVNAYREWDIKLRAGQRVAALDFEEKKVVLDHKERLGYTGVILAVGGTPRIPENLAAFQDLLMTLKTLQDARHWIRKLDQVESALIIGGDLTSLAVTRALLERGKKVYFALNEEAFWPLRSDTKLFEEVAERLSAKGVEVLTGQRLKGLARISETLCRVEIGESRLEVGIIGAFFGLRPDIRFLAGSGLRMDRGILVDPCLYTGFDGVYAAGDCAQIYHPELKNYWVSIGHDNARELGKIAALNMAGGEVEAEVRGKSIFEEAGIRVNTSWWMEF
jgi:NADPH-dependent 2,4-dienoyl-CoA reductase/sulfur reductase-like enzyme